MDIPDIAFSVQFLAPTSLSVWTQRSGRAGRSGTQAYTILLVEPTVFEVKPPPKPHASVSHVAAKQPQPSTGRTKLKKAKAQPGKKARGGGRAARAPVKAELVDSHCEMRGSAASIAVKVEVMEAAALVDARDGGTETVAGSETVNQAVSPASTATAATSAIDSIEGARHSPWQ